VAAFKVKTARVDLVARPSFSNGSRPTPCAAAGRCRRAKLLQAIKTSTTRRRWPLPQRQVSTTDQDQHRAPLQQRRFFGLRGGPVCRR